MGLILLNQVENVLVDMQYKQDVLCRNFQNCSNDDCCQAFENVAFCSQSNEKFI